MFRTSMKKTFIIICCIVALMVSLTFGTYILTVHQVMQESVDSYLEVTHQQVANNIEAYLEEVESIGLSMCYSPSVQHYLLSDDPVERVRLFSDVQAVFSNLYYMDHAITCFSIYDKDGHFLTANGASPAGITIQDQITPVSGPTYATEYPGNSYIGKSYAAYILTLPVLQQVDSTTTKNYIGSIVLTVDTAFIHNQMDLVSFTHGSMVTLTDSSGRLIASSHVQTEDAADMSIFTQNQFNNVDWRLTTYYVDGTLTEEMQPIWRTTLLTALCILGALTFFLWMILHRFLQPITHIKQFMEDVSHHPGTQQYDVLPIQFDELRSMIESMNRMLNALEQKKEELLLQEKRTFEAELAKDRLEILAYRSQINPHFLYNTLECISGMAMMYNANEIMEISQSLSNMFRYAIKGKDFVTVEEELQHMREYATIIRYRFMGRIDIQFSVTESALHIMIPRLVLQPLLENSVFHGLEHKMGKGQIIVNVFMQDSTLIMRVQDNGIGMELPQLKEIRYRVDYVAGHLDQDEQDRRGIGLKNIARRLYLFYQHNGRLLFESIPGQGTTVEIQLPAKREETKCTS